MQESKDGPLLGALLNGDSSAFDQLVERYQSPLIRFARGFVRDRGAAEDLVQETFIRLIRSTPDIGSDGVLGPWLYRVCRNLAYDNSKM